MAYYDEKKGIVLSEDDKQIFAECEPQEEKTLQELNGGKLDRTLIFAWVGKAHQWKEYSEHLKESFRERDEEVRINIWSKGGNDIY